MQPEQCRMARAALSLDSREFAELARVSPGAISRFEAGRPLPDATIASLRKVFERAGIEFVSDATGFGVWLRKLTPAGTIPAGELNATNDD